MAAPPPPSVGTGRIAADAGSPLDQAERLARDGSWDAAIALLSAHADAHPEADDVLGHLVGLRHRAGAAKVAAARAAGLGPRTPSVRAEATPTGDLPEHRMADLDVDGLRDGLSRHGCVLVRGLLEPGEAAALARGVDGALDAFDAGDGASPSAWHAHFTPQPGDYRVGGRRSWVRASGAVWTADCPAMVHRLAELIEATGIGGLITEYLGERPVLSANKWTLRRVPLTAQAGWHQDGAFLGVGTRTINMWLALGDCGTDAPGLDLVPRRFDEVLPTGTDGAVFDWSVGEAVVHRAAGDVPISRPEFRAGDALLFDHLLLHSTAVTDAMTRERHAVETWFFAPSAYPEGQIPVAW